jgi:hypothetical protein
MLYTKIKTVKYVVPNDLFLFMQTIILQDHCNKNYQIFMYTIIFLRT